MKHLLAIFLCLFLSACTITPVTVYTYSKPVVIQPNVVYVQRLPVIMTHPRTSRVMHHHHYSNMGSFYHNHYYENRVHIHINAR